MYRNYICAHYFPNLTVSAIFFYRIFFFLKTSKSISVNPLRKTRGVFLRTWFWKIAKHCRVGVFQNTIDTRGAAAWEYPGCLQEPPVARNLPCKLRWRWQWHRSWAKRQPLRAAAQAGDSGLTKTIRKDWYFVIYNNADWQILGNTDLCFCDCLYHGMYFLVKWIRSHYTYYLCINNVNFFTWSDANTTTSIPCRSYTFMIAIKIWSFITIFWAHISEMWKIKSNNENL